MLVFVVHYKCLYCIFMCTLKLRWKNTTNWMCVYFLSDQTKPLSPVKTSLNDAYAVTCPTKNNKAYDFVDVPHYYETIDGPKVAPPVYETIAESKKYVQCQSA